MKSALRLAPLALALLAALPAPLPAQNAASQRQAAIAAQMKTERAIREAQDERASANLALSIFDLDFPGGTPAELVTAIEKASGRPLNVIIPEERADTRLPALRLHEVTVPKLFDALFEATKRKELRVNATPNYDTNVGETLMVFQTKDRQPTDASIWYFQVYGDYHVDQITRFFSLKPYLQNGLSVDDITTAIRTAWEMSGETKPPALKFHQETQLLIVVGQPEQLVTIRDVLKTLGDNIAFVTPGTPPAAMKINVPQPATPPAPAAPATP